MSNETLVGKLIVVKQLIESGQNVNGLAVLDDVIIQMNRPHNGSDEYKVVCVDLDGVLAEYGGYYGPFDIGEPYPWAEELLVKIKNLGYEIVVFSTRGQCEIWQWLETAKLKQYVNYVNVNPNFVQNNPGKPVANFYVDDRALRFNGNVDETITNIMHVKEWWKA